MNRLVSHSSHVLRSPITVLVTAVVSIMSLSVSYQANATATREAEVRANLIADQNVKLQNAFCGLVEPFGATAQPSTSSGVQLKAGFQNAARELGCTPDPFDGK